MEMQLWYLPEAQKRCRGSSMVTLRGDRRRSADPDRRNPLMFEFKGSTQDFGFAGEAKFGAVELLGKGGGRSI